MCVVQLHDAWARFSRELILRSAVDEPVCLSGQRLARANGITDRSDAIRLIKRRMGIQYEPNWSMPSKCIDAAQYLQLANLNAISTALGAIPSPVEPLRCTRNFLAHRKQDTQQMFAAIVAQSGYARPLEVDQFVSSVLPGVGTRFELWVGELRLIAQACV